MEAGSRVGPTEGIRAKMPGHYVKGGIRLEELSSTKKGKKLAREVERRLVALEVHARGFEDRVKRQEKGLGANAALLQSLLRALIEKGLISEKDILAAQHVMIEEVKAEEESKRAKASLEAKLEAEKQAEEASKKEENKEAEKQS